MELNLPAKHAKGREKTERVEGLIYKQEAYEIIGACLNVYRDKGCGFLEPVYQECLEIEFRHLKIPVIIKPSLSLAYRGEPLRQKYEADFACYAKIILEIKAVAALADEHRAQVLNYLSATGFELGLLVNFGHYPGLEWERLVRTKSRREFDHGAPPVV